MKLRYLLLITTLVTARVFPSLALADESHEVKTYRAQCDRGDAVACLVLGLMYAKGEGVTKDFTQAVALYRKACDGGAAVGCFNLGWMYHFGNGVKQSDTDALNYFGKACDLKDELGCENYARLKKKR